MPIYGFECESCGHQFDRLQKLSDADPTRCPACEKETLRRQLTAPQFRLSGSGWYETDFKKDGKKNLHDSHGAAKAPAEKKDTGAGESAKAAEPKKAPSDAPAAKPSAA